MVHPLGHTKTLPSAETAASTHHPKCPALWARGTARRGIGVVVLLVPIIHEFPHIPHHVQYSESAGPTGIAAHLTGIADTVVPRTPGPVSAVCRRAVWVFMPPWIWAQGRAACCFLPLGLCGQSPPRPGTVAGCVVSVHPDDRICRVRRVIVVEVPRHGTSEPRRFPGSRHYALGVLPVGHLVLVHEIGI